MNYTKSKKSAQKVHKLHRQVPAKVTAYVDEGIKELVEVLNTIPNVCTIESCEGNTVIPARVLLDYGVNYDTDECDRHALVEFADILWETIKNSELEGSVPAGMIECVTLSLEWNPRYHPTLWINVKKQYLNDLVNILRPLCNECRLNKQQSKSLH